MKVISKLFVVIAIVSVITGCSTTQPMSAQDRQAIHTVTVNPNVKKPALLYYMGPGAVFMGIAGTFVEEHTAKKLQKIADDNNIHIDQIVRAQLIAQLKNNGLNFAAQSPADADMVINIKMYGFSIPNGYSSVVVPVMRLEVDMMRNNQVVWSSSYYLDPMFGKMPEYHSHDFLTNPQLMAQAWNTASQKAVKQILSNLQAT